MWSNKKWQLQLTENSLRVTCCNSPTTQVNSTLEMPLSNQELPSSSACREPGNLSQFVSRGVDVSHRSCFCPSLAPPGTHPTISSSAIPFSSCSQSFSASGSFPMSRLFESGGQSIGASASVLPMNIYGWFPLGLTDLISLLSKGLSRVFSSTTVWKHQFFGAQPSLRSSSHIRTWLLAKP